MVAPSDLPATALPVVKAGVPLIESGQVSATFGSGDALIVPAAHDDPLDLWEIPAVQ